MAKYRIIASPNLPEFELEATSIGWKGDVLVLEVDEEVVAMFDRPSAIIKVEE